MSDWESAALVEEFEEHSVPLDVLVTDMDWHTTCYRRTYGTAEEKSMDYSNNWCEGYGLQYGLQYGLLKQLVRRNLTIWIT